MASWLSSIKVEALCRLFKLTRCGEPLARSTSAIVPALRGELPVLLKIAQPDRPIRQEAAVLSYYGGEGAALLFEANDEAMVLEYATPGLSLGSSTTAESDDKATRVVAEAMQALHGARPEGMTPAGLPTLEDWCGTLQHSPALAHLDPALAASAAQQARSLLGSTTHTTVLHGDLHHGNLVWDFERGWLAIDPKGVIGDPAFDGAAMLYNPPVAHPWYVAPEALSARLATLSATTGYPMERLQRWGFVGAVLSALWSMEDGLDPSLALQVAMILHAMGL